MATSRALDLIREVADAVACHLFNVSTDAAVGSLTCARPPFKSQRTLASSKRIGNTAMGEGDEIYLAMAQPSTTLASAVTATASSISVTDGSSWPSGANTPFEVFVDQEIIMVTRSSNTLTVASGGRGLYETRPAAHISGATIYGPATAFNPEQIAAYVASTGVMTPGTNWTIDPGTIVPFDVFGRGVSIWDVRKAVNRALRELKDDYYAPLTLVTDGDMRNAGTGDWTPNGSPTVSKVANTNAIRGPQALRVLATVANDYVQSATITVNPDYSRTWFVQAMVRADVGTATLRAYDVTNSAEIEAETWSDRGWGILDFQFTIPATCQAIAFQLESDTSTSDGYWAYLMAYPTGGTEIVLPSWLDRPGMLREVVCDRSGINRYDRPEWHPVAGDLVHDPANPNNPFRYQFHGYISGPLWLHVVRSYDLLVADAQTTFADRDLLVAAAMVKLCEEMVERPESEHSVHWRAALRAAQRRYAELSYDLLPGPMLGLGY